MRRVQGVEIWRLKGQVGSARTELRMLMGRLPTGKVRRHSKCRGLTEADHESPLRINQTKQALGRSQLWADGASSSEASLSVLLVLCLFPFYCL